jgi:phosphoribosylaminoimidazole carboxylase PurE protein
MKTFVGILMGSESDLPVMQKAADALTELGVASRVAVASAHRSPDLVDRLVKDWSAEGAGVFIAGAGAAAHLAGVVASKTVKPVIGVPIGSSKLNGLDALLSTAQMPPGIPVAAVAVDGARNAGILAAQILGTADAALGRRLQEARKKAADEIEARHLGKEKSPK